MRGKVVYRGLFVFTMLGLYVMFSPAFCPQAFGKLLTLKSKGTTIVLEGHVARARNMAIANGKRNAVEAAVKELIPEQMAFENYDLINETIYHRHERFIDTFRILSERSRENVYEVMLESTVNIEKLRRTLVSSGLMEEDRRIEQSYFRLEISGVSCSLCFKALEEYLHEMEGVEEVSLYSISPGRFTLNVVFRGNMETFEYVLTSRDFEGFRLEPEGVDEEYLRVVMVLTDSEEG